MHACTATRLDSHQLHLRILVGRDMTITRRTSEYNTVLVCTVKVHEDPRRPFLLPFRYQIYVYSRWSIVSTYESATIKYLNLTF